MSRARARGKVTGRRARDPSQVKLIDFMRPPGERTSVTPAIHRSVAVGGSHHAASEGRLPGSRWDRFFRADWQRISNAVKSQTKSCPGCEVLTTPQDLRAFYKTLPEDWDVKESWYPHGCFGVPVKRPWDREDNIRVLCIICYDEMKQAR